MKKTVLVVVLLAVATLSCNLPLAENASPNAITPSAPATDPPELAETNEQPTMTAEAAAPTVTPPDPFVIPHGNLIYQSALVSGWPDFTTEKGTGTTTSAGFEMSLESDPLWGNWIYSSTIEAAEFYSELTLSFIDCAASLNAGGLLFHYTSPESYRYFIISCDGDFFVMERTGTNSTSRLLSGSLPNTLEIFTGAHTMAVLANDDTLTFFIDSLQIGKIEASTTIEGDIGMYIQTEGGKTALIFSNLAVYEPE